MKLSKNKLALTSVLLLCFGIVIAFTGTSCNTGNNYPKQTATLDSLTIEVRHADSVLMAIDSAKIKQSANHIMTAIELIKMAHKDSMSKGAAEIFRNYNSVRWAIETFSGRRTVMLIEMRKSMDNMTRLSHDLKLNLIKADSVSIYYNEEVKRASLLVESEKIGVATYNAQMPLYEMIRPQADSLITLIKNHKDI